jgi:Carboxypeptidase regulatory-like domain/TonB-dependent Receptor Plug Domain
MMFVWNHDGLSSRPYLHLTMLLALFSAIAWSQTQLATIFGAITDPSGATIPEAAITIVNESTGLKREVLTSTTGQYRVPGLPTGEYMVQIEKPGFQTQLREAITLTSASEVMINASLIISDQPQQVSVAASATAIDNTTSTVSGLVSEQSLAELPLNGRDLFRSVALEPGVAPTSSSAPSLLSSGKAGQVSIDGMRPSWTNLLIDGMDANDPVFGFSPAGASGLFLGLNELAEVRVLTQTSGAEYARSAGGVIEEVTKSGSNQFHGSLFELHRNAALDAKNYFDLGNAPIPAFVRNQFGAGAGGPLVHDRTFFFANYEGFAKYRRRPRLLPCPTRLPTRACCPLPATRGPAATPHRPGASRSELTLASSRSLTCFLLRMAQIMGTEPAT